MGETYIEVTEGSGKKVSAISCTIGGYTVYTERATIGIGQVTLPGTPQVNTMSSIGYSSTYVDIQGRFWVVIKNTFNDVSAYCAYRLAFYDASSVLIGFSEPISIYNTGILDGSRYVGASVVYTNDYGATLLKLYVEQITSGDNFSAYIVGV